MRRSILLPLLLSAACAPYLVVKHPPSAAAAKKVVVLPFADAPDAPGSGRRGRDAFREALLSVPGYELVETGPLDAGLSAREAAGAIDESRAVALAKSVGADAAVLGEVTEYRERHLLIFPPATVAVSVRLVDAGDGLVAWTATQRAGGYKRLLTWIVWPVGAIATAISPSGDEQMKWSARSIAKSLAEKSGADAPAPVAAAPAETPSAVDSPTYKRKERPDDYAVVIGVEKYSQLPPAEFAARDAAAVKAHLRALGVPERNIAFVTDAQAGRSTVEKFVEQWLPRRVRDDSRVYFYFSGHGAPDLKGGGAYLVPWDGDADYLESTGYPVKRLYEKLGALPAKEVLVAMDACFSGAGGRSVLPAGARPLVATTGAVPAALDPKLVALTAASGGEISGSEASFGHGAFTYYLLAGLNGGAKDGTVRGLYEYLKPRVQDAARRRNRDQTPTLIGDGSSVRLR